MSEKHAIRPCYIANYKNHNKGEDLVLKEDIEFVFNSGFAPSQKQKNVVNLHNEIINLLGNSQKILEISSKSTEPLGYKLSAFNLNINLNDIDKIPLECAYQGSKIFEKNKKYDDLYFANPKEAKRDDRLKNSGEIIGFEFKGNKFKTEPKSAFYEWLYILALKQNKHLAYDLISAKFEIFTDIEFNPKKSISNQAKAAGLFCALYHLNLLDTALKSTDSFIQIVYPNLVKNNLFS
ncbi:DarT1-associated NADAR antitoxin family protein [Campylobacter hyointestinalis]|uniref:Uncharacterized protein n=1 Tax=Campylobacter hyointestinalis subsp. hyointestinalis TaxID=91352 RepID=A0A855NDC9_CAMHY|nr:hypothetical protein [Campylobacter hyointestinalis]MDL2346822.1 hypothetical protein [Campylobacter hyointestinalis]MDL2348567.1 hypothetical protein [Campylobacter hyointestinalis]MDL2350308.1 hypothetical protein [Campylobacter hyointestinalis]MDM1026143.1 hypothetical protein [Campylobacter hyointestinalis]MDM1027318.1 hypothetical protein [Campylobacter hyointestinalis]